MTFIMLSSFKTIPYLSETKAKTFNKEAPVFFASSGSSVLADGSTYVGTVTATGAINAVGTYEMPTKIIGNALHCTFLLYFPKGTITIRMNCNMITFLGVWQITEGTGDYQNIKGNGTLIMPDDLEEYLYGTIRGM
jgi:hypothetical protein